MYSRWLRNSFLYLLILVAVIAIVFAFFQGGDDHQKVGYGQVVEDAKNGLVQEIEVNGRNLTVTYVTTSPDVEPDVKSAKIGPNSEIEKLLADAGVALSRPAGTRLMVGQQILDLYVGVRLLRPQPAPHRFHRPGGRFLFSASVPHRTRPARPHELVRKPLSFARWRW